MNETRLEKQIAFILEVDKMKNIYRQTLVLHEDRRENDAEHSWHLALMAFLLAEHSNEKIDVLKVIKMVLIHDLVEIDAGDTYCYDEKGYEDKEEREMKAAHRIFALLPEDQQEEIFSLWREFEEVRTPEAKFAAALDRMQPSLLNYTKGGASWTNHGVRYEQAIRRNLPIQDGSCKIWDYMKKIYDCAKDKGYLSEK